MDNPWISDTAPAATPVPRQPGGGARIAVGVAGWSYPDWKGFVYTGTVHDQLRFVAGYLDMVEVNSTFYRPPDVRTAASWVKRTEDLPDFFFTAKLHQDITHHGRMDAGMVRAFREGLAPLTEAGQLRHLLAQFKYDFADTPETRGHLARIRDAFGGLSHLTLELRHSSWQAPEALDFCRDLGVTVAALDYPLAANSFRLRDPGVGEHAYLRLHGRNTRAWFDKGAGRDQTYNYLYPPREVDDIYRRAVEIAHMSKTLTLVANNHYQGKEMVNALQLRARALGHKVEAPPGLVERYPELRDDVVASTLL